MLTILGCGPVHNAGFTDTAGNIYIVKLDLDDSTVQILIKAVNTYDYISVDHYIQSLNLNITTLMAQVNAILNSASSNEVISTIGIESTINVLTWVPSTDVASLIESLFMLRAFKTFSFILKFTP